VTGVGSTSTTALAAVEVFATGLTCVYGGNTVDTLQLK
jgi:hypothetical protein